MKPSEALVHHRDQILRIVAARKATRPRIFGSVLHGADTENSDIDLLVDPLPETTLFDLGGMQVDLEELLGVRVDVLTPADLPARYRDQLIKEARPL